MTQAALMTVLIAVCAWITVPSVVPFTMQTFGVFCALGLLGGRTGTAAVALYIALGAAGLPVFSGFRGGLGILLGPTGGYIAGFLFSGLAYWLTERCFRGHRWQAAAGMVLGLLVCYAFGTAWFMTVYARQGKAVGLAAALGWCVFPFLIPDLLKIALALLVSRRVRRGLSGEL